MILRLPFELPTNLPAATAAVREAMAVHLPIAVPTETFYGLAVDPTDLVASERIYALKGRPRDKALPVVGADLGQLESLVEIAEAHRDWLAATWPAPLTVVLPARPGLPGNPPTLAVRVPAHDLLRALLWRVGPLTATSANLSGGRPSSDPAAVIATFSSALALLLDGGLTAGGAPTTLLDCSGRRPRLLRRGLWTPPAYLDVEIV